MTSWLRRLSRDRASKDNPEISMPSRPYAHTSNIDSSPTQPFKDTQYSSGFNSSDRLQSYGRPNTAGEPTYHGSSGSNTNNLGHTTAGAQAPLGSHLQTESRGRSMEPAPDPLTRAFNDALRPYIEQIEDMRAQLDDTTYRLQRLEDERADMHAWIDKRGLRAGE